jgi:hypothetical protein
MQMQADMPTVSARFRSQHPNWVELFKRCDDPLSWEAPQGFERSTALRAFRAFVSGLEECLGHKLDHETGSTCDESTFHAEIFLSTGSLRFSNFGKLVGFVGDSALPAVLHKAVSELAEELGYVLVPHDALDARYVGRHARPGSCDSWQQRFFE